MVFDSRWRWDYVYKVMLTQTYTHPEQDRFSFENREITWSDSITYKPKTRCHLFQSCASIRYNNTWLCACVVYKGVSRLPPCVCAPDVTAENPIKDPTGDKRARHTLKNILLVFQWHEAFILVSFLLAWSSTLRGSSLGKKNRMGVDGKSPQESYKTQCVRVCTECVTVTCVRWWECVSMQCLYDRVCVPVRVCML